MMSAVQERDLTSIGATVQRPAAPTGSVHGRRQRRALRSRPGDRLGELAAWWASVADTPTPRRVELFWQARPAAGDAVPGDPDESGESDDTDTPDDPAVAGDRDRAGDPGDPGDTFAPGGAEVVIRHFEAPADVSAAVDWGVSMADDAIDAGADLLLVSLPSSDRDDLSWQVLAVHLLDIDLVEATGWPNLDRITDAEWSNRVAALRDGLRPVRGIRNEPERLLTELASPALAAGTGLLLQAAARRTPALLDGPGAAACALLAHRVARAGRNWWQATDAGDLGLHDRILTELRLFPLTRLGLPGEDATAARIGLGLLETALARALTHEAGLPEGDDAAGDDAAADDRETDHDDDPDDDQLDQDQAETERLDGGEDADRPDNVAEPSDTDEPNDTNQPNDLNEPADSKERADLNETDDTNQPGDLNEPDGTGGRATGAEPEDGPGPESTRA
jgi:phosphoribosyltransferase-like protein